MMSLRCYMLELMMVTDEEDIKNRYTECVYFFTENLPKAEPVSYLYKYQSVSKKKKALFKNKQTNKKRHFRIRFEMMFVSFES